MSVSTVISVVKQHEIDDFMQEIDKCLKDRFGDKYIEPLSKGGDDSCDDYIFKSIYFTLYYPCGNFTDNKESRILHIHHQPKVEMKRDFYQISFNVWGHNEEIANCLVDWFGGYANYSDCDNVEIDYCVSQSKSKIGIL
jgi:hypothetical protein